MNVRAGISLKAEKVDVAHALVFYILSSYFSEAGKQKKRGPHENLVYHTKISKC